MGIGMIQCWECLPPTNVAQIWFWPGFMSRVCCQFFLALLQGFFSGFSRFPPSTKTSTPNSNFPNWPAWEPAKADLASYLNIVSNSFICLFLSLFIFNTPLQSQISVMLPSVQITAVTRAQIWLSVSQPSGHIHLQLFGNPFRTPYHSLFSFWLRIYCLL